MSSRRRGSTCTARRAVEALVHTATGGGPGRVMDAGCGTGRVALELARRGHTVTGIDLDPSMLIPARDAAAAEGLHVTWLQADLLDLLDLPGLLDAGAFDVVAAPGNVVVYLTPGTEPQVVAALLATLRPGGLLVAGFAADRHVTPAEYDGWCRDAGAAPVHAWATWDGEPLADGGAYAVMVHRR